MCNTIWGDLFVYTPDSQPCLHPYDPKKDAAMISGLNSNYEVENCYPETSKTRLRMAVVLLLVHV